MNPLQYVATTIFAFMIGFSLNNIQYTYISLMTIMICLMFDFESNKKDASSEVEGK